ncbi:hypothetical protein SLS53_002767 [Cytospora paraplurivora]|uniref:MACPF-like domain-containing protein n=1 Tax=Cytospora paraplurivora TaxID=2898453 RepID=A0AAN9UEL8_9PEZI
MSRKPLRLFHVASASYGQSSSDSEAASQESSKKSVTIAYNFPRVTVLLDGNSLELTMECQRDLAEIKDAESLTKFLDDYGEFFSARVQLGGRLFATEEVEESSSSSNKTEETKKAMKAAASASFGSFSASVSASHDENATAASSKAASNAASTLTWQARGGDTLLCNDPTAWCPTVGDFYYWRITKQERVSHVVDFIGTLPGFESVPENVAQWRKQPRKVVPVQAVHLKQVKDGKPASFLQGFDAVDLCYDTPYRLRDPVKGYIDFDASSWRYLYMTNVKSNRFFVFHAYSKDWDDNYTPRPIPQLAAGARVALTFVDMEMKAKGLPESEGDIVWAGHDSGCQYLRAIYRTRAKIGIGRKRCGFSLWTVKGSLDGEASAF